MTEAIANWMNEALAGFLPPELIVFLVSMIPILELRGGMIIASLYGFNLFKAFAICILGNVIPIPFILWLITPVFSWMKRWKIFRPLVEKLESKATGKKSEKIRKASFWGLLLFVGIPLPGTGAWTGSLIAALLDLDKKRSLVAAILGVLLASVIMALISYGIPAIIDLFV
ncbi:MAG: small multi-drug export protein [Clostridia bacterium]|nr:small multi-drug export protein [Clostridia bacterium]